MAVLAKSPAQVIAGEATYNGDTWSDMMNIASVIANRAMALGVTPAQVVASKQEFHAYNKALPAGADVELAERALQDVLQNGPINQSTFYAMPTKTHNLPPSKQFEVAVEGGHQFFTEPTGGAIHTSVGYRAPVDLPTARAAYAQRMAYETALVNDEAMPTPEARPDMVNLSQNPALLAGQPISQVDPATLDALPGASGALAAPDLAMAQSLQSIAGPIDSLQALQAALSSLASGVTAQRDYMPAVQTAKTSRIGQVAPEAFTAAQVDMPNVEVEKGNRVGAFDADRFGDQVGPVARTVQTVSIPAQAPQVMSDAASVAGLVQGMNAQRSTVPTVDVAKSGRIGSVDTARFGEDVGPVAHSVKTVSVPGQINSPEALSDALSTASLAAGMDAQRSVQLSKGARLADDSAHAFEAARMAPVDANAALQAAIEDSVNNSRPAMNSFADLAAAGPIGAMNTQPNQGVNSPEMQAMQDRVRQQAVELQNSVEEAKTNGEMVNFERTSIPYTPQAVKTPTVETWSDMAAAGPMGIVPAQAPATAQTPSQTMTPEQISGYNQMAQEGFAAGLTNLAGNGRINGFGEWTSNIAPSASDFAAEVQAGLPAEREEYDNIRANVSRLAPAVATPEEIQNSLVEANRVPVPAINPMAPQSIPAAVPALETVEVAPQPSINAVEEVAPAAITPAAVTKPPAAVTNSMPAVQQRQSSAMDVWSGKAQTGIATDGSTVSRISDNKIGRYVPEFDYTTFSTDDGATWSSPVAGNQLTPAKPALASIQPAVSRSLISRLVAALTGVTAPSPTDPGPSLGLDGGMTVSRDGPAGLPSGSGPGGFGDTDAGGYGSTNGVDPNGTR